MAAATPSQTIGPYWHLIEDAAWSDLTRFGATGEIITLTGKVTDGEGQPVADAASEIWQASPAATDSFPAFGRCRTDDEGEYRFTTLKPGPVPGPGNTLQAPHIAITLFARGLLTPLRTRAYFAGEPLNDTDPILALLERRSERETLIARWNRSSWRLDIRLQGENETAFMEI